MSRSFDTVDSVIALHHAEATVKAFIDGDDLYEDVHDPHEHVDEMLARSYKGLHPLQRQWLAAQAFDSVQSGDYALVREEQ